MTVATNPLTYNGFVTQLATLAVLQTSTTNSVVQTSDDRINAAIPQILNYAELRIQREADLLPLQTYTSAYTFTSGSNLFQVPVADFVTVQTLGVDTGSGAIPLTPVAKEWLQNVYGSSTGAAAPQFFAPYGGDQATAGQTSTNFIVGPWPDQSYPALVTGTQRMPSLYLYATQAHAADSYTLISTWLPDALLLASMIYVSALQRNWGKLADDPAMALSFEQQYQVVINGVRGEEARKKFAASAWTALSPPVNATPGR